MVIKAEQQSDFKQQFELFSGTNSKISLPQIYKWFKQAEIFDGFITANDIEMSFNNLSCKKIDYDTFTKFLESLFVGKNSNLPFDDYLHKLISCGKPGPKKTINIVKVIRAKKEKGQNETNKDDRLKTKNIHKQIL